MRPEKLEIGMKVTRPPKYGTGEAEIRSIEADKRYVWIWWGDRRGNIKNARVMRDHIAF